VKYPVPVNVETVRWRLAEKRLTQVRVARFMDISPAMLTRLLGGDRRWKPEHVDALADALNMPPEALLVPVGQVAA
jgi:transcriptional regulator with XRE-family HTH domain